MVSRWPHRSEEAEQCLGEHNKVGGAGAASAGTSAAILLVALADASAVVVAWPPPARASIIVGAAGDAHDLADLTDAAPGIL